MRQASGTPEGNTVARLAAALHDALARQTITRFAATLAHLARIDGDTPPTGRVVERCTARSVSLTQAD